MLSPTEAKDLLEKSIPEVTVKVMVPFRGSFLVRGELEDPNEAEFTPFFIVNPNTSQIDEFSPAYDGDMPTIIKAFSQPSLV
jgi:hypothetical protein